MRFMVEPSITDFTELVSQRRWRESFSLALALRDRGVKDPLIGTALAVGYYERLEYTLAIRAANATLEIVPNDVVSNSIIAKSLSAMGYSGWGKLILDSENKEDCEWALVAAKDAFAVRDYTTVLEITRRYLVRHDKNLYLQAYQLLGNWMKLKDSQSMSMLTALFRDESHLPSGRLLALGFEQLGEWQLADDAWTRYLLLDPGSSYAKFSRIRICAHRDGWSKALEMLDSLPEWMQSLTESVFLRAWLNAKALRFDITEELCWILMGRSPEDRRFVRLTNWVIIRRRRWHQYPRFFWMGIIQGQTAIQRIRRNLPLEVELRSRKLTRVSNGGK